MKYGVSSPSACEGDLRSEVRDRSSSDSVVNLTTDSLPLLELRFAWNRNVASLGSTNIADESDAAADGSNIIRTLQTVVSMEPAIHGSEFSADKLETDLEMLTGDGKQKIDFAEDGSILKEQIPVHSMHAGSLDSNTDRTSGGING